MQLKIYQQNTLSVLRRFLEKCRISGAENAYNKLTNEHELKERLGSLKSLSYVHWDSIPDTPRVCLKVPTGGGKTILAAHAVKIAAETVLEKEYPVVLWFCPSDTIRRQTAEALKNHRHPYRQTLDEQFGIEHVRVFDIDEKFNIMPQDIAGKCCIIVSTIQAFRQSKTDKYKVYAHHENLENHFRVIPKPNDGKFSFANLLAHHRPVMIVDEAHNVLSDLSKETAGRLNPAVILEWTATPQMNNNTLYNVHASELKDEEMIKLPIALVENAGWEQAVDQAIIKRKELEQTAEKENENNYLRPLLLFQAQDKNGEVNVAVLKDYLLNTANIPEHEIAVVTGEQKELDGVNIAEKNCPVRYVITVEALKEGWDCPFAYVLCSLANVKSDTAVLQLLGRVMRMPYAAKRQQKELNKAYAYVVSKHFGEAAQTLVERLIEKGFEKTEAAAAVETVLPFSPNGNLYENQVDLETALAKEIVPPSMMLSGDGRTITFTPETTDDDIAEVCRH
ncbi:MAG: DEAD/DEAH box helicase family protein, partial [Planctomycetaceae bacterium]|nr:DEAD/DEAH box helicase family protein [Planctomycetaceae bacterium]